MKKIIFSALLLISSLLFPATYVFRPTVSANWASLQAGGSTGVSFSVTATTATITYSGHNASNGDTVYITNSSNALFLDNTPHTVYNVTTTTFDCTAIGVGTGTCDIAFAVWYDSLMEGNPQDSAAPGLSDAVTIRKKTCTMITSQSCASISIGCADVGGWGFSDSSEQLTVNGSIYVKNESGLVSSGHWQQIGNGDFYVPYYSSANSAIYEFTTAQSGKVTTIIGNSACKNIHLGAGRIAGGWDFGTLRLNCYSANPIVDINPACVSNAPLKIAAYVPSVSIGALTFLMTERIQLSNSSTVVTFYQTGNWYLPNATYLLPLSVALDSNGYNLQVIDMYIGLTANTATWKAGSGTHKFGDNISSGNGLHTGSNVATTVYADTATIHTTGKVNLTLVNWVATNCNLVFTGTISNITLTSAGNTICNITVSKPTGTIALLDDLKVSGNLSITTGNFSISTYSCTVTGSTTLTSGTLIIGASTASGLTTSGLNFNTGSKFDGQTTSLINNSGNFSCDNSIIWVNGIRGTYTQAESATYINPHIGNNWHSFTLNAGKTLTLVGDGRLSRLSNGATNINGEINVNGYSLYAGVSAGSMNVGASGNVSGAGTWYFISTSGGTYVNSRATSFSFTGTVTIPADNWGAFMVIPSWDYSNANVSMIGPTSAIGSRGFTAGTLKSLAFAVTHTGNVPFTLDNATYNPSFNVAGNYTINQGTGLITWSRSNGTITLSDGSASINLAGKYVENIDVNATGSKEFTTNFTTGSFALITGNVIANSYTFQLHNNFSIVNGTWQAGTSTLKLIGNGTVQQFNPNGRTLGTLSIDKLAGYVNATSNCITARLIGTGGYLRSTVSGLRRTIYTTARGYCIWMTFKDINAGYKNAVNAKNSCTNAGNNLGIVFRDAPR